MPTVFVTATERNCSPFELCCRIQKHMTKPLSDPALLHPSQIWGISQGLAMASKYVIDVLRVVLLCSGLLSFDHKIFRCWCPTCGVSDCPPARSIRVSPRSCSMVMKSYLTSLGQSPVLERRPCTCPCWQCSDWAMSSSPKIQSTIGWPLLLLLNPSPYCGRQRKRRHCGSSMTSIYEID